MLSFVPGWVARVAAVPAGRWRERCPGDGLRPRRALLLLPGGELPLDAWPRDRRVRLGIVTRPGATRPGERGQRRRGPSPAHLGLDSSFLCVSERSCT